MFYFHSVSSIFFSFFFISSTLLFDLKRSPHALPSTTSNLPDPLTTPVNDFDIFKVWDTTLDPWTTEEQDENNHYDYAYILSPYESCEVTCQKEHMEVEEHKSLLFLTPFLRGYLKLKYSKDDALKETPKREVLPGTQLERFSGDDEYCFCLSKSNHALFTVSSNTYQACRWNQEVVKLDLMQWRSQVDEKELQEEQDLLRMKDEELKACEVELKHQQWQRQCDSSDPDAKNAILYEPSSYTSFSLDDILSFNAMTCAKEDMLLNNTKLALTVFQSGGNSMMKEPFPFTSTLPKNHPHHSRRRDHHHENNDQLHSFQDQQDQVDPSSSLTRCKNADTFHFQTYLYEKIQFFETQIEQLHSCLEKCTQTGFANVGVQHCLTTYFENLKMNST